MIIVSEQARAAGAGSVPNVVNDADAPWFVWQGLIDSFQFATGTGFNGGDAAGKHYTVDSKAMRKVGVNEDMVLMVANVIAGDGALISVQGRFLMKLT